MILLYLLAVHQLQQSRLLFSLVSSMCCCYAMLRFLASFFPRFSIYTYEIIIFAEVIIPLNVIVVGFPVLPWHWGGELILQCQCLTHMLFMSIIISVIAHFLLMNHANGDMMLAVTHIVPRFDFQVYQFSLILLLFETSKCYSWTLHVACNCLQRSLLILVKWYELLWFIQI